jgi:phenylalanyl-tRNA synthetase beta chain
VIDVGKGPPVQTPITLRLGQIERVLGITIGATDVERILVDLGLERLSGDEHTHTLTFRPPSWRSDLEREIDLIEEVARIHGYHHIPEDHAVPLASAPRGNRERVESAARQLLTGAGLDEAVTFSLVDEQLAAPVGPGPAAPPLKVDHSSRKRESSLRQSLIPSLLAVRLHNESHGQFDAELFEIANVYLPRSGQTLPREPTRLAMVSGRDFRGLKGVVEALLAGLHVPEPLVSRPIEITLFSAARSAELLLGETHLGYLGEIDHDQLDIFELRESCTAAELEFGVLLDRTKLVARHHPLPPFPAVVRDLSLVVALALPWSDLRQTVVEAAGPTLESVEYLDTFRGGNLSDTDQSVHFGMTFRHPERTLTGDEVERAVKSVLAACEARYQAKLRS